MWREATDAILAGPKTSPGVSRERRDDDVTSATAGHPQDNPYENSLAGARAWFAHNGLTRPREGRVLSGVTVGFARRFGLNRARCTGSDGRRRRGPHPAALPAALGAHAQGRAERRLTTCGRPAQTETRTFRLSRGTPAQALTRRGVGPARAKSRCDAARVAVSDRRQRAWRWLEDPRAPVARRVVRLVGRQWCGPYTRIGRGQTNPTQSAGRRIAAMLSVTFATSAASSRHREPPLTSP